MTQPESIFDINKVVMRCLQENHEMQRLKYLCIDQTCSVSQKLGCADCFLDNHHSHKKLLIEHFINNLKDKYLDDKQNLYKLNEETNLEHFQQKTESEIDLDMQNLKQQLCEKLDSFSSDLKLHFQSKLSVKNDFITEKQSQMSMLTALSSKKFESLNDQEIQSCLQFFQDDRSSTRFQETSQNMTKLKQSIQKSKVKYFERLKILCETILEQESQQNKHSQSKICENPEENSSNLTEQSDQINKSNNINIKRKFKKVQFAAEETLISINTSEKDHCQNDSSGDSNQIHLEPKDSILKQKFSPNKSQNSKKKVKLN